MFHVASLMNPEQHRRLIGNDIVVIIFQVSNEPLDISYLDELGIVPQVFGIVRPFSKTGNESEVSYRFFFLNTIIFQNNFIIFFFQKSCIFIKSKYKII